MMLFLCFIIPLFSYADNIRGLIAADLSIENDETIDKTGTFRLEDLCVIRLDENISFIKAIELRIDTPDDLMDYIKSMQIAIYHTISPEPESTNYGYKGISAFSRLLLKQKTHFIQIPLTEDHDLEASYDTWVSDSSFTLEETPLLLTIQPIMKGVPDSLLESLFTISAKPLFLDQGGLKLVIEEEGGTIPEGELFLYIDNAPIEWPEDSYVLDAGIHTLDIDRNGKRTSFSFHIEKGVYNSFTAVIPKPEARVVFELPEESELFFDGEFVDFTAEPSISVLPGEHILTITFNGYQTTKKISLEDGKTYNFSLILDILMEER